MCFPSFCCLFPSLSLSTRARGQTVERDWGRLASPPTIYNEPAGKCAINKSGTPGPTTTCPERTSRHCEFIEIELCGSVTMWLMGFLHQLLNPCHLGEHFLTLIPSTQVFENLLVRLVIFCGCAVPPTLRPATLTFRFLFFQINSVKAYPIPTPVRNNFKLISFTDADSYPPSGIHPPQITDM